METNKQTKNGKSASVMMDSVKVIKKRYRSRRIDRAAKVKSGDAGVF